MVLQCWKMYGTMERYSLFFVYELSSQTPTKWTQPRYFRKSKKIGISSDFSAIRSMRRYPRCNTVSGRRNRYFCTSSRIIDKKNLRRYQNEIYHVSQYYHRKTSSRWCSKKLVREARNMESCGNIQSRNCSGFVGKCLIWKKWKINLQKNEKYGLIRKIYYFCPWKYHFCDICMSFLMRRFKIRHWLWLLLDSWLLRRDFLLTIVSMCEQAYCNHTHNHFLFPILAKILSLLMGKNTKLFFKKFLSRNFFVWTFARFHRIISSFRPRHTSAHSPDSFCESYDDSFFFECFDHIFATTGNMFTIGCFSKTFCPETVIRREEFLITLDEKNKEFFYHAIFLRNCSMSGFSLAMSERDFFFPGW